jgi:hypothetical protein
MDGGSNAKGGNFYILHPCSPRNPRLNFFSASDAGQPSLRYGSAGEQDQEQEQEFLPPM